MDKSKIEQIKQENAAAKIQGMKWLKILLFVLGACAIIYGVVTLISSPNKFMAVLSIVIGVLLVLAGLSVKNKSVSNAAIASASTQYGGDVAECQATYQKIVELVKHDDMKAEFGYIADEMKKDVDKAADLAAKLTNVNSIIDSGDQLDDLEAKLAKAKSAEPQNETTIKGLEEKVSFAKTMNDNRQNLELQLQRIKQNLSAVYTKLMVLDTTDTGKVSETGAELQKLLDRKITAQKFEQEL
ncbi:MAG: DUF308 domain-containing protein [Spirochaetales bacterium]|nr:DUF308 domain-containing protein [Spirochaetales bacterium]MBR6199907.1 DUF308 domain-containing protein [Spirochaetales bacterium]